MSVIHLVLFITLFISSFYLFRYLHRARVLFDDRFSMTISIVASTSISFLYGLHLTIIFQIQNANMMMFAGIIGVILGYLFGSFSKRHFIISGVFNGVLAGVMGAMAGQVLMNPSLCGLPWNFEQIQLNTLLFNTFATCMVYLTLSLLLYSFRA
ncbi:hypothetical protein CIB95_06545 [Lottiidibacillus patelloidae]|uniref:Uncharacterized protein n=1 Tax=Lottiidibacillus patelloidae TaxID=2670334 RepID=A0A263BTR7_9BACI|nr:hypothetical protein [Lottiidibacillus patelloidae]OZM57124.1 hypothetical protein CIB95_06545 [Lottiidibacillus patelloidae]